MKIQHLTWTFLDIWKHRIKKKASRRSYITGPGQIPKEKHNEWGASFTPSPPTPNHRTGTSPNLRKGSTRRPCQQRGELTPDPGPGFVVGISVWISYSGKSKQADLNGWKWLTNHVPGKDLLRNNNERNGCFRFYAFFLLEKRTLQSNCHWFPAFLESKVLIIWKCQLCGISFLCGQFFQSPTGRVRRTFLGTGQVQGTASPGCWFWKLG